MQTVSIKLVQAPNTDTQERDLGVRSLCDIIASCAFYRWIWSRPQCAHSLPRKSYRTKIDLEDITLFHIFLQDYTIYSCTFVTIKFDKWIRILHIWFNEILLIFIMIYITFLPEIKYNYWKFRTFYNNSYDYLWSQCMCEILLPVLWSHLMVTHV